MKTLRTILLSGAVLAMSAQAAQRFEIPFAFETTAGKHQAGRYEAHSRHTAVSQYIQLRNVETGKSVYLYPTSPVTSVRKAEQPRLEFACNNEGNCQVKRLWQNSFNGLDFSNRVKGANATNQASILRTETIAAE